MSSPIATGSWNRRLNDVMPWGSSTCSKAPTMLPDEPEVIVRGEGCRVWDERGRELIDFRLGLGPVTLGYRFPAVDEAVRRQLETGIVFGHPHPLECEVAELIRGVSRCAEQVRFLKTGGEAIAACVKLARAYTGRERVIQVGYNGWLNALAAGGRVLPGQTTAAAPAGVPGALSALHHAAPWDDVAAMEAIFEAHPKQVAAVVVAADYARMAAGRGYYPKVRELTRRHGSVLIYDEIVTGFRVANAGVQEYFGVTPDMAVYAKGIANGLPLSAYVGRREIMSAAKGAVVSSTYGGETLSLAGAKAAITTVIEQDVVGFLWRQGESFWPKVGAMMKAHGLPVRLEGFYPCVQWTFDAPGYAERFFRAAYRNGLSLYSVSYLSFSHRDDDLAEALRRFERVCDELVRSGVPRAEVVAK